MSGKEIVEELAQWRDPDMKARRDPHRTVAVEGVDAAIPARAAGGRSRVSGPELTEEAGKFHVGLVGAAKERELNAWKKFKVCEPVKEGAVADSVAGTRWCLRGNWWTAKRTRRLARWPRFSGNFWAC